MSHRKLILIRGAGEFASGVAHRLFRCHFPVIMTELPWPRVIRRKVSFAEAIFSGRACVEGVEAICTSGEGISKVLAEKKIPILIDQEAEVRKQVLPEIFIDAAMAKRNLGTEISFAPLVITLGPGFKVGQDAHCIVETNRGHHLGRILEQGQADENTGIPGTIAGVSEKRVVRAPCAGYFRPFSSIGEMIEKNQKIGEVNGVDVLSPLSGIIRGLIYPGYPCSKGMKIGDVDPRGKREFCYQISDKARTISGSVLEIVLRHFKGV